MSPGPAAPTSRRRGGAAPRLAVVAIALCLASGAAHAAPAPPARDAVQAALKAQEDAWNHGDLAAFLAAYLQTPDLTSSAGGQFVKGYDALRARYGQSYGGNRAGMGTLRFDEVEIAELGAEHALTAGKFHVTRDGKPVADGAFTLVWLKTAQGWRIMHDHRTSLASAGASAAPAAEPPKGLLVEDLAKGSGDVAISGMRVTVHYTGWLQSGQKFDSSLDRGQPFAFVLGQGQVIPGWEQGVAGMRVGGKRRLTIPPHLGYGARGAGGVIPPNATLIFEVELLGVGRP